jgi:hypothetical protein
MEKHSITIALVLLLSLPGFSQQVYNAAGRSATIGSVMLEWSLGEVNVQSAKTDYSWTTEGVLQPQAGIAPAPTPETTLKFPSLSSSGLDNAGTTFTNTSNGNNVMLEFTLGETASKTLSANNQLLTQGILQPFSQIVQTPLPVLGLELAAKRISPDKVQLDWKTLQEITNRGFGVERMKQNENNYGTVHFEPSKAPGGNSSLPLQYQHIDNNAYSQKTFYRLRQEDLNGKITYYTVQVVQGARGKIVKLSAYPNPAVREFSVLVDIISSTTEAKLGPDHTTDVLEVYDISGRRLQQFSIASGVPLKITGLKAGVYLIKLQSETEAVHKVVVQ